MRHPWANPALLVVLALQLATGFWGLTSGAPNFRWVLWLHGMGGYAVALLLIWKGGIVLDVFRRRPRWDVLRVAFLLLAAAVVAIIVTGVAWVVTGPHYLAGFSLMTVHAALALLLGVLLAWHVLSRRFIFRVRRSRDRRAFLRLLGTSVAGVAVWQAGRTAQDAAGWAGVRRRFTGSYETGSQTGQFPVVSWLFDDPRPLDPGPWRLTVDGAVERPLALTYAEIGELARSARVATLDCTGGWYSEQEWQGVAMGQLLDLAGVGAGSQSVTVEAVSGYYRRFPLDLARQYLLATHVAGRPLDHGHGFPLRLVCPDQRGFNWVKWVVRVHVDEASYLWQPPLPLR